MAILHIHKCSHPPSKVVFAIVYYIPRDLSGTFNTKGKLYSSIIEKAFYLLEGYNCRFGCNVYTILFGLQKLKHINKYTETHTNRYNSRLLLCLKM